MPYNKEGKPQIGDRVRHLNGKIGTVTYIELKGGNTAGRDIVAVKFDDRSVPVGMLPAAKYTLIFTSASPFLEIRDLILGHPRVLPAAPFGRQSP